jgi:hypothetical protein
MAKLDDALAKGLKVEIRSLSREAAIQVLLGIVESMVRAVSLKSVEFPEFIHEAKKYMEMKNGSGA